MYLLVDNLAVYATLKYWRIPISMLDSGMSLKTAVAVWEDFNFALKYACTEDLLSNHYLGISPRLGVFCQAFKFTQPQLKSKEVVTLDS